MRLMLLCIATIGLVVGHGTAAETELTVVLRFVPHRLVTSEFRQAVRSQVSAGMTPALRGLAAVRIFDDAESRDRLPFWDRIERAGLDRLDRVEKPEPGFTHVVTVRFERGTYEIASRGVDGTTGWCSPVVRREGTADRALVGRLILGQLLRDFPLTGDIVMTDGETSATVQFDGTASDRQIGEWIRRGDVFAVLSAPRGGRAEEVPHTYLVAKGESAGGKVMCRLESRYDKPLAGAGPWRAVRLGAEPGPLSIRFRNADSGPLPELSVRMSAEGFRRQAHITETGKAPGGQFVSRQSYDRLGFATILAGDRVLARVPIPVLGPAPLNIEIHADAQREAAAGAGNELRSVAARLRDFHARTAEDATTLKKLVEAGKNVRALDLVNGLARRFDDDIGKLQAAVAALRDRVGPERKGELDDLDRRLRDLRTWRESLDAKKNNLERVIAADKSPEAEHQRDRLRAQLANADGALAEGDGAAAIAAYQDLLKRSGPWPEVEAKLKKLQEKWAIRSEEHRAARAFVYDVFAKASAEDVLKHLPRAREALTQLKNAGDSITGRKLYLSLVRAADLLAKRDEELRRSDAEDGARQRAELRKAAGVVRELLNEAETLARGS